MITLQFIAVTISLLMKVPMFNSLLLDNTPHYMHWRWSRRKEFILRNALLDQQAQPIHHNPAC